ncbi:MAG TPA: tRNA lysidine(34) synthetase TilS [Clostridiales bacterium]|nr:tRNA lysidine(34) synthetase TilS [Clostridiales bacterium]
MEQTVKEFIAKNHILDNVHRIVLAVSGGADSMALAYFMLSRFPAYDYQIAHLNHGLREAAASDEELVRTFAADHGVPFRLSRCDIAALAKERRQGLEETGREERYGFFRSLGADLILTAHHKNDAAETVLLHLIRGSGLKGVAGMAPREGDLGRPFLCVLKEDLVAYCQEHGVAFAEDATNADTAYTRNKVRHRLLPLMETINPDVVDAIYRFSVIAAGDDKVLDDAAVEYLDFFLQAENADLILDREDLLSLAEPMARRVIRAAAAKAGSTIDYGLTEKIFGLKEGKALPLTKELWVRLEENRFLFGTTRERSIPRLYVALPLCGKVDIAEIGVTVETRPDEGGGQGSSNAFGLFPAELFREQPPVLRYRQRGDWVLLKDGKSKKLSDYFIDEKIAISQREKTLLLAVGKRVLWVVGRRFFAAPGERNILIRLFFGNYSNN